jgi:hypothetical protein
MYLPYPEATKAPHREYHERGANDASGKPLYYRCDPSAKQESGIGKPSSKLAFPVLRVPWFARGMHEYFEEGNFNAIDAAKAFCDLFCHYSSMAETAIVN